MLFSILFLSACSDQDKDALVEVYPKEIMDDDERKAADKSFEDPLADGTLTYQVMDCKVYDDIADAGIKKTDIRWPENMYADAEKTYEFQTLSDYMGEDKEPLVLYTKDYLKSHPNINFFIYGHRHIELDLMLNATSRVVILGDWINCFSYAVFDSEHLFLENYIEGETRP